MGNEQRIAQLEQMVANARAFFLASGYTEEQVKSIMLGKAKAARLQEANDE